LDSNPKGYSKVTIPWAGYFFQEGVTVQSFAIKKTVRALRALQQRYGKAGDGRMHFIGHQANLLMLQNVCRSCDIPDDRHLSNVANFGNTGTAGAPAVLSGHWEKFGSGDQVAIVGVGAGLTWASMMIGFGV
jgi:3-oxoacyl-[acyl-carrier-protein] synthase-3